MALRIMIILILSLNVLFPVSTAAELDNYHFKIIQIAFMNGYSRAIDSDIETIALLKKNDDYLRSYMETAVEKYMQKVVALNKKSYSEGPSRPNQGSVFKPDF